MLYTRDSDIEAAPLQDETILLQPAAKTFCLLNKTAAFIWNEVSEQTSSDLIARRLAETFTGVSAQQARSDVESALRQLVSMGFVSTTAPKVSPSTAINEVG